jgi:hypothetical protein
MKVIFWVVLFIVSYFTSSLLTEKPEIMNHNVNRVYDSLILIMSMITISSISYNISHTFVYLLILAIIVQMKKSQTFVDENEYILNMLEKQEELREKSAKLIEKINANNKENDQNKQFAKLFAKDIATMILSDSMKTTEKINFNLKSIKPLFYLG